MAFGLEWPDFWKTGTQPGFKSIQRADGAFKGIAGYNRLDGRVMAP
jgi:hypothetical protein